MSSSLCNRKGIGLPEVIIAIFITTIGVMAILSLQPSAWRAAARSDYLGRAAELLYKELDDQEILIMNPCNVVTTGGPTTRSVRVSGMAANVPGDATYTVATTVTSIGANIWRVTVRVTWPINPTGISASLVVTRQERFRFPEGCPSV
jgi:Tfp pilus assembly protein PilV